MVPVHLAPSLNASPEASRSHAIICLWPGVRPGVPQHAAKGANQEMLQPMKEVTWT